MESSRSELEEVAATKACTCSSQCICTCCRYLGNIGHDPGRSTKENEMDDRTEQLSERMDRLEREG